jgi:hypothetical protein
VLAVIDSAGYARMCDEEVPILSYPKLSAMRCHYGGPRSDWSWSWSNLNKARLPGEIAS